jgi:diguanylate cyclase (GGDEF)-like protein
MIARHPDQTDATASLSNGTTQSAADAPPPGRAGHPGPDDQATRWDHLLTAAADLAFETDEWGRFSFLLADPSLGWSAATWIGQSALPLLADTPSGPQPNPFRAAIPMKNRRIRVKRGDGCPAWLAFTVSPIHDAAGALIGTRGLAVRAAEAEASGSSAARQGELSNTMLRRVNQEVLTPRKIRAALNVLSDVLSCEGGSVIVLANKHRGPRLLHQTGAGADGMLQFAASALDITRDDAPPSDARRMLVRSCQTRFGDRAGIAVWRALGAPAWTQDDEALMEAGAGVIRLLLEHELVQQEMARHARTDSLTGLLTRRAFLEELERHTDRLDREALCGTLMIADLDGFQAVNDALGHESGDQVLVHASALLRRIVRPSDLVARLGGDQFGVWFDGVDHMTAAERAEYLCEIVPTELGETSGPGAPRLGISIGIAARLPHSQELLDQLIQRADTARADVKRHGKGHWRVSQANPQA